MGRGDVPRGARVRTRAVMPRFQLIGLDLRVVVWIEWRATAIQSAHLAQCLAR